MKIIDQGIIWKNPHPSAYARMALWGQSVLLPNGQILHGMQVGEARMNPSAHCMLTRSSDSGKTWSAPQPVRIDDWTGRLPNFVMLSRTDDGRLLASAVRYHIVLPDHPDWRPDNGGWVGADTHLIESSDGGQSWRIVAPIRVPQYAGGFFCVSSAPLSLDGNGNELFVVLEPMFSGDMKNWNHQDLIIRSRDGGKTWDAEHPTILAKDAAGKLIFFDPRIARLRDGRWCTLLWTHEMATDQSLQARITYSRDEEPTDWSEPRELPFWGFLSVPLVLRDGRLLAIYNHRRTPQQIRCIISEDGGATWRQDQEIVIWDQLARKSTGEHPAQSQSRDWQGGSALAEMFAIFDFGIPHAIELPDGTAFVSFYATQLDHVMHQRFVRLSP